MCLFRVQTNKGIFLVYAMKPDKKPSILAINKAFWTQMVPETWEKLTFDNKLAWIMFGVYTVSLLTLIEIMIFKR